MKVFLRKVGKYLKHPSFVLLLLDKHGIITLPDRCFIKLRYKAVTGKRIDLAHPVTFNEKIQWLKLYDHNPMYTDLVDKYKVKKVVKEKIGNQYIVPIIGLYDNFAEINFDELPDKFVIKCTHDSGGLVICRDKNNLDVNAARKKINKCLKTDYYRLGREWPYKNVKPRIIIEEYLDDIAGDTIDYKFMCYDGKVKYIFTCSERFSDDGLKVTWFDVNWNKLNFERHYPASKKDIKKPGNLNKMIQLAEELSIGIPFVRIDFYNTNGKIYFGEYTFYPGSGLEEFNPPIWDRRLGDPLILPEKTDGK